MDLEKKVIGYRFVLSNFKLYKAPLTEKKENFIRENKNSVYFFDKKNWI